ncbi:MAG: Serine/threonine-protein kinase BtrW [Chlamydiae bacterium]|nr:Serine/threonine-protein kinase BtrW [Chlamydiota bacterium]
MDFAAAMTNLSQMLGFIRQEASRVGVDETHIHKLELASEEALVNIISYAYPKKEGKILIQCSKSTPARFEITIRDQGVPFNPNDADVDTEVDKPMSQRKIGGLGIFLIRKMVDELSYRRDGNENVLKMTMIAQD